jgi:hypothetical protein
MTPTSVSRREARAEQPQQPADILSRGHVQGPAQEPGPHQRAFPVQCSQDCLFSKPLAPGPDGECRRTEDLGLDATEVANDVKNTTASGPR